MPARFYANVTCPACHTSYQTPVEQVLDTRADPGVKNRLLSSGVNVAVCPACGAGGTLNLPFIYHDPEKEVALLYLPIEAGKTEVERQRFAGKLTQQLMNSLPAEERKGYLFQPETFIAVDTLIRRVLELEGVTEADMERSRLQQSVFAEFLRAEEAQWEDVMAQHPDVFDERFFALFEYMAQLVAMAGGREEEMAKLHRLQDYLIEKSGAGQLLFKRSEVMRGFMENPSRETLLQALMQAPDEQTVDALIQSGISMMDYAFFQTLLKQIEAATPEDKERLTKLRKRILEVREQAMQAGQEVAMARLEFLRKLMVTEDTEKMIRSHFSEVDDTFLALLQSQIEMAEKQSEMRAADKMREIAQMINHVMEESLPPEVVLVRRLLMAADPAEQEQLLQDNAELLHEGFFQMLDSLIANSEERGEGKAVTQLQMLRDRALRIAAPSAPAVESPVSAPAPTPPSAAQPLAAGEKTTPSGLIIARR